MDELIQIARRICRITWNDDETDARMSDIVGNAVDYLHHKLGMPGDPSPGAFLDSGGARMLFENYCLYCWNDVPEEFEQNYRREILTMRHKYEVEAAQSESETESTDV